MLVMVDDFHWLDQVSAQAILFAARRLRERQRGVRLRGPRWRGAPGRPGRPPAAGGRRPRPRRDGGAGGARAPPPTAGGDGRPDPCRQRGAMPLAICEMTDLAQLETPAGAVGISDIVEELYARRTAALSESAQAAIVLLAADEEASLATVERALPRVGSERSALDELEAARLVTVSASRIWFRHRLVRAAVYQRASPDERRRAHAALAAELDDGVEHDRAVLHRAAATVGTDDALARELSAVAAAATARHGYAAAAVALERAAELASGPAQAAYLHAAAAARWDAGDSVHAQRLADAALARGPGPALRADIQALRAHLLSRGGPPPRGVRASDRGRRGCRSRRSRTRGRDVRHRDRGRDRLSACEMRSRRPRCSSRRLPQRRRVCVRSRWPPPAATRKRFRFGNRISPSAASSRLRTSRSSPT